jgi:hypothetical protein
MIRVTFLIIALLFLLSTAKSQNPPQPCYPDCYGDIFQPAWPSPALTYIVTLPCGTFTVKYRLRYACLAFYDIYIEEIGINPGTIPNNCNTNSAIVINMVIEKFVKDNPMNYPPYQEGDCADNWRIMKGGCWIINLIPDVPDDSPQPSWPGGGDIYRQWYEPCEDVACCVERIQICIVNGQRTVQITGYNPPTTCEDPHNGCFPVCGENAR